MYHIVFLFISRYLPLSEYGFSPMGIKTHCGSGSQNLSGPAQSSVRQFPDNLRNSFSCLSEKTYLLFLHTEVNKFSLQKKSVSEFSEKYRHVENLRVLLSVSGCLFSDSAENFPICAAFPQIRTRNCKKNLDALLEHAVMQRFFVLSSEEVGKMIRLMPESRMCSFFPRAEIWQISSAVKMPDCTSLIRPAFLFSFHQ